MYIYVETKYQEIHIHRGGGAQLSCGLKAISVSNFSSEFLSQEKFFSNQNDQTCHVMFVNT